MNKGGKTRFSIGEVSQMTGVNAVTLRAWYRRFGLVEPERTAKGHRLYSLDNINEIKEICTWIEKGIAISKVRPLLRSAQLGINQCVEMAEEWHERAEQLTCALLEFNHLKIHRLLDDILALYPFSLVQNKLLQPWFSRLDALLVARVDGALLTAWLQGELTNRLGGRSVFIQQSPVARVALVSLPDTQARMPFSWSGQEGALLLLMLELASLGVSVVNLGKQHIANLSLIGESLQLDAIFIIPHAHHTGTEQKQIKTVCHYLPFSVYLQGPFASTVTLLTDFLSPPLRKLIPTLQNGERDCRSF